MSEDEEKPYADEVELVDYIATATGPTVVIQGKNDKSVRESKTYDSEHAAKVVIGKLRGVEGEQFVLQLLKRIRIDNIIAEG